MAASRHQPAGPALPGASAASATARLTPAATRATDRTPPVATLAAERVIAADLAAGRWGALAVPNYRTYFFASAISQSGGWLLRTAQSWLVLDLTGSPAALGVLALFQFLPITCLTLFAGVLVDRVPSRWLLVATQSLIALQAAVLGALVLSGRVEYWHVLALAAVLGLASAFDQPARSVFVSQLVGPRRIGNAVALNSAMGNGARIIGPGLGGLMIALWGTGICFTVAAAAFVLALVGLFALRADQFHPKRQAGRGAVLGQLWDGVRYSFSSPSLGVNFVLMAFIGTFAYNWGLVLPLLARYALDGGPEGFGALNIAMGLGSVLGGLLLAWRLRPSPRLVAVAAGIYSLLVGLVGLAPSMAIALGLLLLAGVLSIVYSASSNTLLQLEAREEYRGRVLALYMLLFAGSTPIGSAVTGLASDRWDIRVALGLNASLCLLGVLLAGVYVLAVRRRTAPSVTAATSVSAATAMTSATAATAATCVTSISPATASVSGSASTTASAPAPVSVAVSASGAAPASGSGSAPAATAAAGPDQVRPPEPAILARRPISRA